MQTDDEKDGHVPELTTSLLTPLLTAYVVMETVASLRRLFYSVTWSLCRLL